MTLRPNPIQMDTRKSGTSAMLHFTEVHFENFKAFPNFRLMLKAFNILVGPNNAGKSTIIAAFRILSAGIRRARSKRGEMIRGPNGQAMAYPIDMDALSVSGENVFYNYEDSNAALVKFSISNGFTLNLYFPEAGTCYLIPDAQGRDYASPSQFKKLFDCSVGFVPILGPVDHDEPLYNEEAARRALFNYRAARNFRNIWHHFPEKFDDFRKFIQTTWPGMDVAKPEIERVGDKVLLKMYCPEERIDREIVWSGFGFQVWCQMLTHLIQSRDSSIFLIDEPDIYLHSDLQRQLIGLLRDLGPDIIIATHSTEIVTEAEPGELVLINKKRRNAKRIIDQAGIGAVFSDLGSNVNPILTQLAKTKKAVFVEGLDFQIISHIARKIGSNDVANRGGFAVIPMQGFNPSRAKILKEGIELTLGGKISAAVILDRDYRSMAEIDAIAKEAHEFCQFVCIHQSKEIENFLLIPDAIDRAIAARVEDRKRRTGKNAALVPSARDLIRDFCDSKRTYVASRHISSSVRYAKETKSGVHADVITEAAVRTFECEWDNNGGEKKLVPGKDALSYINQMLQEACSISVTSSGIVSAMRMDDVPIDAKNLILGLAKFAAI